MTLKILILDDDAALVRMAQLALAIEGFDVTTAGDGLAGLQCLQEQRFDAIILDLQMPKMDGRGFLSSIREGGITTPVLIVSAYESTMARVEMGADGSIKKPFEPDALVAAVRQLLTSSSPAAAS